MCGKPLAFRQDLDFFEASPQNAGGAASKMSYKEQLTKGITFQPFRTSDGKADRRAFTIHDFPFTIDTIMLIVMKADATDAQIAHVCDVITELGFKPHAMPGATRTAIGITGNQGAVDPTRFENLPGVGEAIRVSKPYKLISLDLRPEKTIVRVGDATIGGDELAIIAGPCAIESHAQAFAVAEAVRRSGARFFRGGAFQAAHFSLRFPGSWVKKD